MQSKDSVTLKWILKISGRSLWWTVSLTLLRIVQGLSCLVYAWLLGEVVDSAAAGETDAFYRQLLSFVLLVILTLVIQSTGRWLLEKSKALLERRFRMHGFGQLLRRDYAKITNTHTGEWMNRITSDTGIVVNAVATIVPELTGAMVRLLGALIALMRITPSLASILLPCGLLMTGFSYFVRKPLKRYHKQVQQILGKSRSFIQEQLYSLMVLRVFTQENAAEKAADRYEEDVVSAKMQRLRFTNLCHTTLSVAINGAQVLGIGLCGWGILNGVMTYGTMSSVLYLVNLLESPFATLTGYISQYFSMLASAERLMEIEEYPLDSPEAPVPQHVVQQYYAENFQSMGLQGASFAYGGDEKNTVLKDFSLNIPKGTFVAFTGESGCGKSTTLKLLLSLYPLDAGCAYLQNMDGEQLPLDAAWRGLFAYVPQGNQLISGTIRETITFGDRELMQQEEKIQQALRIACADSFVKELPNGLDTVLGERGSGLSEGQMQRLSLARAVLSGRPVLLLDEATSALDAETETQLLINLRAMTDRTVVIITHREAALEICDQRIHFEKTASK